MREDAVPGRAALGAQPPRLHAVLLAVAGEVDDDLLATVQELAAIGEESQAVELLVASLVADRTALPAAVRSAVVELSRLRQIAIDAAAALAPAGPEACAHRFTTEPGVADALLEPARVPRHAELLDVLRIGGGPAGAQLRLAWRLTPAGAAPGPVPHPVLLAELADGHTAPEIIAYRLGALLARNGIRASVEAYPSGEPLPPYQLAALRHAVPIGDAAAAEGPTPQPTEPVQPGSAAEPSTGPAPLTVPAHADLAAVPTPSSGLDPVEVGDAEAGRAARHEAVAEDEPADPPTIPFRVLPAQPLAGEPRARHSQPEPPGEPAEVGHLGGHASIPSADADDSGGDAGEPGPVTDEPDAGDPGLPGGEPDEGGDARRADGSDAPDEEPPLLASMRDPLTGPLSQPLLAPLLDPTSGSWGLPAVRRPGTDGAQAESLAEGSTAAEPVAEHPDLTPLTELTQPRLPARGRSEPGGPDPAASHPSAPFAGAADGETASGESAGADANAETRVMREVGAAGSDPAEPDSPEPGAAEPSVLDPRANGSRAESGPAQPDAQPRRGARDAAGRPRGAWHPDPSWTADWVSGAWAMPRTGRTTPPSTSSERSGPDERLSGPEPGQPGPDTRYAGPGTQAGPAAWHAGPESQQAGPDGRDPGRDRRPSPPDGDRAAASIWLEPAQAGAANPGPGLADAPVTAGEPDAPGYRPEPPRTQPGPAGVDDQAGATPADRPDAEGGRRDPAAQPGASPRAPEPAPYGRRAARDGVPTFQPPPGSPPAGARRARHRSPEDDGEPAPMPPPRPVPRLGHRLGGPPADPPDAVAPQAGPAGENPDARPAPDDAEPELRAFREQLATPWTRRSIPPRPPRTNGHRPQP